MMNYGMGGGKTPCKKSTEKQTGALRSIRTLEKTELLAFICPLPSLCSNTSSAGHLLCWPTADRGGRTYAGPVSRGEMGNQNSPNRGWGVGKDYFISACWWLCSMLAHSRARTAWPGAQLCCSTVPHLAAGDCSWAGTRTWARLRPQWHSVSLTTEILSVFPEWMNTNPKGLNTAVTPYTTPRMHPDCVSLLENRNQFALKRGCDT